MSIPAYAFAGPAPADLRFHPLRDSATMLRRNLRHMQRYPSMTVTLIGMPIVFLLLFVYVFGGTLAPGSAEYPVAVQNTSTMSRRPSS